MASKCERILAAAHAALDGPGKPDGCDVYRNRVWPTEQGVTINVRAVRDEPMRESFPAGLVRRLTFALDIRAVGDVPETRLDDPWVWSVQTLTSDATLQGLVRDLTEAPRDWDAEAYDQNLGGLTCGWTAEYETDETDPTT